MFYIKLQNGEPIGHPLSEENCMYLYDGFNPNNLPDGLVPFIKTPPPILTAYQLLGEVSYVVEDDRVIETWNIVNLSADEIKAKQDIVKQLWKGFASWTFDEDICAFKPPIPYPADGKHYHWEEDALNWVEYIHNNEDPMSCPHDH